MFFCDKCNYLYDVTKEVSNKQIGGKINDALNVIFNKFTLGEKIQIKDLKNITNKDIKDDLRFDEMTKKDQKKFTSWIKTVDKTFFLEDKNAEEDQKADATAYFICKNCKRYVIIEPATLIYRKNYGENIIEAEDYSYSSYDSTLPRTKNYICKNANCETHNNINIREAVITKNITDQVVYVCTVCKLDWVNTL